jgi:hypothetical protein
MSIAQRSQSPAPPWATTRVQAALGLLLFAILLACFIAYGFVVLLPELLRDNIELIFERYNTLLPDLANPAMPVWMWVWAAAAVLGALVLSGAYLFLTAASRHSHPGLFWLWLGALAALLAPPVLVLFLLPGVPKFPGGSIWWFLTGFGLTGGFFYVAWMYYRDSHGVGPLWASLLGLLRAAVFSLLAFFFMLPAVRDYKDSYSRSKVLVLFDVSGSMAATIDDIPTDAVPLDKLLSRQDKVLQFLADEKVHFLKRLEEKNPIDVFRFARGLDPEYLHFSQDDRNWTRGEYDAWVRNPNRDKETPPAEGLPADFWKTWLKPAVAVEAPADLSDAQQERFRKFLGLNDALAKKDADYLNNTNVGDSVLSLLDNESKKMLQGVVIFTDGRSTEGSSTGFAQVEEHARAAHVPIFVVGIGEERPQVKIEIADLRMPQQIQPDDKFPAVVEITGEGLPEKDVNAVLELTYSRKGKDAKEEELPIVLMESIDAKPGATPTQPKTVNLGKKIVLHPTETPKFDRGSPPRVEVSYQIDALALAAAAGVDLKAFPGVRKWEIAPTLPDAELRFRARVPKDSQEIFGFKDHVSDPASMVVQKKPLRVLLFASAATHEYQFVQAMLVRDMTKQRVKVASYLQMPPGRTEPREGIVQDAQLLHKFPDQIDRKFAGDDEKLYDLSEYDVIVAFDPDWNQLSDAQIKLLKQWADKGGGFIDVAGPVNTLQLARPAGAATDRLKPILQLLPVTLRDIRLEEANRDTDRAWPLDFSGATPDMEFLKLAEETGDKGPPPFLADWKDFFGPLQADGSVNRGFYNFYPVENAKAGAQVVARFADPRAKLKDGSYMPYIVLSNPADPDHRVVWIGWGEMWRLRQKNEAYLERFWTKLTRYAGALNQGKVVKRITPNFGRVFTVGQPIVMEARIDDKGGVRLNENAKPKVMITPPLLGPKMTEQQKLELENLQKEKWMSYKPKSDGWFQVKFKPPVEGDYTMEVTVNETGDKIAHKFTVKPSNPELDNVRPDFARMVEMASYADEDVQPRMSAADYTGLLQKLQRPKLDDTQKDDRPRLYFNLKNAGEIPQCMDKTSNQRRDYSDPRPIWNTPVRFFENRVQLGWYAFTALVGLMSLEWLIRKLLRLA